MQIEHNRKLCLSRASSLISIASDALSFVIQVQNAHCHLYDVLIFSIFSIFLSLQFSFFGKKKRRCDIDMTNELASERARIRWVIIDSFFIGVECAQHVNALRRRLLFDEKKV